MFENVSKESSTTIDVETIEHYRKFPMNLADVSSGELALLPYIDERIAENIIDFVESHTNTNNDQICDSLGLSGDIEILLDACTYIGAPANKGAIKAYYRARSQADLNEKRGFTEGKYLGDNYNFYQKLEAKSGNYSLGILTDRDAGELPFIDFYSGYVGFRDRSLTIIAGDFVMEKGMGNVLWRAFGSRKGVETVAPVVESGKGIIPYSSSMDVNFFRGTAASFQFDLNARKLTIGGWVSSVDRSATIDSTGTATSVYVAGYYRTDTEIEKKDKLNEKSVGGFAEFNTGNFLIGATAFILNYSNPIESKSSSAFNGSDGVISSIYSYFNSDNYSAGTELSLDGDQNIAYKVGVERNSKKLDLGLNFRYFSQDFRSPFGGSFSEFSYPSNEAGIYFGAVYKPLRVFKASFYSDFYSSLGKTYTIPQKVKGSDIFIQFDYSFGKSKLLSLRLRSENKTDAFTNELNKKIIYDKIRSSIRCDVNFPIGSRVNARIRGELAFIDNNNVKSAENGALSFFEMNYTPLDFIDLGFRTAIYKTDSYDSAIWTFEYAAPGLMTSPALYGAGARNYFYARIHPSDFLRIVIRYTDQTENSVKIIGSSWDEIVGNSRQNFLINLEINF